MSRPGDGGERELEKRCSPDRLQQAQHLASERERAVLRQLGLQPSDIARMQAETAERTRLSLELARYAVEIMGLSAEQAPWCLIEAAGIAWNERIPNAPRLRKAALMMLAEVGMRVER